MYIKLAAWVAARSIETYHFFLPPGGAVLITQYLHMNVFGVGLSPVWCTFDHVHCLFSNLMVIHQKPPHCDSHTLQ